MRFVANDGLRMLGRGLVALGLVASTAVGARAQMVFDGNIVFNNNASGTLAGQFIGTAPGAAAGCPAGMNTAMMATTTYTHNVYVDPLLPNAPYVANVVPSFQPSAGSPAFINAVVVPNDGFFEQTCYVGAIGPNPGDDWTLGWTYYDSTGANRTDIDFGRPLAIYDNINLFSPQSWSADSNYEVRGKLRIKSQSSLTIAPGVVILEDKATTGTIIVERGGQIHAVGTVTQPIVITSNQAPGSQARGDVGGLVINGYARTSVVNSCAGDSAASEGGQIGFYGGNNDTDDSGELRYVRSEYSGKQIVLDNELNSFLFNAVGSGTEVEFLQAFAGADDCFEYFGGVVDGKYLIGIEGTDDGWDTGGGYRGRGQFVIIRHSPRFAPQTTNNQSGDRGWEADNNEAPNDFNQTQCSGRANPLLANATFVGDKRAGAAFPGPTGGIRWRRATAGQFLNGIITNFKESGVRVDDEITWTVHCAAIPAEPQRFCNPTGVVNSGQVFISRGAPNPFRDNVTFHFALPQAGDVRVEVYSAAGQRVATIDGGTLAAGQHRLSWRVGRETPGGVYFYRVISDGAASTGRIIRID